MGANQTKHQLKEIASQIDDIRTESSNVLRKLESKAMEAERWRMVADTMSKRYNAQTKQVAMLIKKNAILQKKMEDERSQKLSILERVRQAVEENPEFENEIRDIIHSDYRLRRDYQRVVESNNAQPEPDIVNDYQNRQVESDSVESDSMNDFAYEQSPVFDGTIMQDGETGEMSSTMSDPLDMDLEASAAIAYVLGKMSNL